MNESHPTRPPLATIICIYLAVTAFIPLEFMWILLWGWLHSFSNYPSILLLLPHTPMPLVICALALVGTIALWQMPRAAFSCLLPASSFPSRSILAASRASWRCFIGC